nr:hypothetical protein [uncultured bacterium]
MGFVHYSSATSRRLILLTCIFLSLTDAAGAAQAREGWHAVNGPDGDFSVEFPAPPASETIISEQLPFIGQKMFLYSYKVDGAYMFTFNYKDLSAKAASMERQQVLAEYERGLFLDAWSVVKREKLPDGGWQYEAVTPLQVGFKSPPEARLRTRVYFRGSRMYTLAVLSHDPNSPADQAQHFFSTLRFLKAPPPPPTPRRRALTAHEVAAARGALKSLRRLAAAEAVTPDYDEYTKLLLEVKGEVDDYLSDMGPGEVRDEISLALEAYTDLRVAWNSTRGFLAVPAALYQPQRTLIAKYGIPIDVRGDIPLMNYQGAVSTIFKAAREHINRASALLAR